MKVTAADIRRSAILFLKRMLET